MEGQIHTIEDLALLIVETMASKEDIQELEGRVNTRLDGIDSRLDNPTTTARLFEYMDAIRNTRDSA